MLRKLKKGGWYGESHRHSLAARGMKTGSKRKSYHASRGPKKESRNICRSCYEKTTNDPTWENWYYKSHGVMSGSKNPKGTCRICGEPLEKKRQSIVGLYQPREGGAVEQYYGHDKEEIFDQAHRIHGKIDAKKFKFKKGKFGEPSGHYTHEDYDYATQKWGGKQLKNKGQLYEREPQPAARRGPKKKTRWIPHWLYERTQKNEAIDPHGMGYETADRIVARSNTRKQIEDALKEIKKEKNQSGFSSQTITYYNSLENELEDYLRKSDSVLDMYRGKGD